MLFNCYDIMCDLYESTLNNKKFLLNKPWWKCLHTCDKWRELSYYKSACSDTGFYNCVKQPATASR